MGNEKVGSNSPKNDSDQETEFDSSKNLPEEKAAAVDFDGKGKNITDDEAITANSSRDESLKSPFKPKGKRGRPRREGKEKTTVKGVGKDKSPKKQEWVHGRGGQARGEFTIARYQEQHQHHVGC